jgi:hypothetical protein
MWMKIKKDEEGELAWRFEERRNDDDADGADEYW